jgi:hypothetical protein
MHNGVNLMLGEDTLQLFAVPEIHLAKSRPWRHSSTMPFNQAVQRDYAHAPRKQDFCANAADVSCSSSYENIHLIRLPAR